MVETPDLIERLARAGAVPSRRALPLGTTLAFGVAPAFFAFLAFFGFRDRPGAIFEDPLALLRVAFLAALALAALSLIEALGRPGARVAWSRLAAPFGLLAIAFWLEQSGLVAEGRAIMDRYWLCPAAIAGLSITPVAALLIALRSRAPTRPGLAGAIAGLAGGAIAATLYAFWCAETAPGTTALWFGLALAITSAGGAIAGRHLLRW
jgi:hypothetical protein